LDFLVSPANSKMINDLWYKNAIIYCLSVGTYMDANGDGIGDFTGLMRRLDYLHGLGITAIWLMPFQVSPHRDDGYDVSDYYGVDPRYGTIGDFVEFTHAAKQRGIRVLIDLVVNHTSNEHSWFKEARSDPQSKYRADRAADRTGLACSKPKRDGKRASPRNLTALRLPGLGRGRRGSLPN
jgi:glycosidase